MKRFGNLFDKIVSWENLVLAARLAGRGKAYTRERISFENNLEKELCDLRKGLISGEYMPGAYRTFTIYDPKERLISAAPYRDRVAHHALCNIIEPVFDRSFLPQNYANRKGRGLHMAIKAGSRIINKCPYLLKTDIKKYFPSIDHAILKTLIRRKIKCPRTLAIIDLFIDNSGEQEPVILYFPGDSLFSPPGHKTGLPIGNLTSQLFANIYLDGLDHFIVQSLRMKRYARYVDDLLIGGLEKEQLREVKGILSEYMARLRLKLHNNKTTIFPARRGVTFLGFRLYPGRILAGKRCGRRFILRLKQLQVEYAQGKVSLKEIKQVVASYNGHLSHGATERLRTGILNESPFCRAMEEANPEDASAFSYEIPTPF